MSRINLVTVLLAVSASAQDHVFPLGFSGITGPPTQSVPVARVKDANFDGIINTPGEISAFMTSAFPDGNGRTFMRDGEMVIENGEPAFYFGDTETGDVVRGSDDNHDGFLDSSEITEFFTFGRAGNGSSFLGSPEAVTAWNDPATGQTIVYAATDNTSPSALGYGAGIHRLTDLNGDRDATDPGEYTLFVSSSMGLTVPGNTGPVTITLDFWDTLTCLPGGKLIAWADGLTIPAPYVVQPEMNAFYGFTDNGGVATAELWFNCSQLNDLPRHPDFVSGTFPDMDIQATGGTDRANFVRFIDVAPPFAPGAPPTYYIGSSYNSGFDTNPGGTVVSGLFYRVQDANNDQVIDAGELTLFANISGSIVAGLAPVTFTELIGGAPITQFGAAERPWAMDVAPDGSLSYLINKNNGSVLTMQDTNFSGTIEQNELGIDYETGAFGGSFPYSSFGTPFWDGFIALGDGIMPGPFPAGITPIGDGCTAPTRGMAPVMDAWNGAPQVGNLSFQLGPIRGVAFIPGIVVIDFAQSPVPVPLGVLGLPSDCFGYLANPQSVGFSFADAQGRMPLTIGLPNNPGLAGLAVFFQSAILDPQTSAALPFHSSNALQVVIQP